MTSLAADRTPSVPAPHVPGALRALVLVASAFTEAVRTARAYDAADTAAARRRVLEDFAAGSSRAA
jgi:hypothetical protein